MRWSRRVALAMLLAAGAASEASAQPKAKDKTPPVDVETAEHLYSKLDYDRANETAERLVKQRGLSHDELVRAYRVLAVTYAILDQEERAREAFLELLVLDPDYSLDPNLGPKVSTPFVEARGQFRSLPSKPGIDVAAELREGGGQLRIVTRDPTHVIKRVTVGYRWSSSGDYVVTAIGARDGRVDLEPALGRTRLDYYAQALDERERAVFEAGSPQAPKSAFFPQPQRNGTTKNDSSPIWSSPVFWILTGAAVAAGGTALFFALRPEAPPTSATLSPQIRCGPDLCQ